MSWRGTEETKHNTAKSNNTGRQSVLQLTTMSCATTAEPIKTTFGVRTRGEPPISWGADRPTKIALWGSYLGMPRLARGRYSRHHSLGGGSDAVYGCNSFYVLTSVFLTDRSSADYVQSSVACARRR